MLHGARGHVLPPPPPLYSHPIAKLDTLSSIINYWQYAADKNGKLILKIGILLFRIV